MFVVSLLFLTSKRGFQNVQEAKNLEHIPKKDMKTQKKQRLSPCGTELLSFFLSKTLVPQEFWTKKRREGFRLPSLGLAFDDFHESHNLCDLCLAQATQRIRRCFRFRFRFRLRFRRSVRVRESVLDWVSNTFGDSLDSPCVASFPALALVLTSHSLAKASDCFLVCADTLCESFRDFLDGFSVCVIRHVFLRKCVLKNGNRNFHHKKFPFRLMGGVHPYPPFAFFKLSPPPPPKVIGANFET
mgnify:CR=1 FL=1